MRKGKKIGFEVRERIVPGSMIGVIPFIAEAIAHLTEIPSFNDKPYTFIDEAPEATSEYEFESFLNHAFAPNTAPASQVEPQNIHTIEAIPLKETIASNLVLSDNSTGESINQPLEASIQNSSQVNPNIPDFFIQPEPGQAAPLIEMPQMIAPNTPPVAILDSAQQGVQGNPNVIDSSHSYDLDGQIVKYQFDFGDGSSYTETPDNAPDGKFDGITTHSYDSEGKYNISLIVTDNQGASASTNKSIDIASGNKLPIFLSAGDTSPNVPGIENPTLVDSAHTNDAAGTPWVEGRLDAVKNDGSFTTLKNILQPGSNWTAIANAYDQDGSISDYHFYIKDNSGTFIDAGTSSTGQIEIDHNLFSLSAGVDYQMKVVATDNLGGTAISLDSFHINKGPSFLNPGDTNPNMPGLENTVLSDASQNGFDKLGTPWIEGHLDAVKNDGSGNSIGNIVQPGSDWTAIARAYDPDGSIEKYDFFIKDDTNSFVYAGSSLTGEINIDHNLLILHNGADYQMKVIAYDNTGTTAESDDVFHVLNKAPIFLSAGDTSPNKAGLENALLADPAHTSDDSNTPWIEGKFDAVKNDGSANSISNVVQEGQSWVAIANAYDPDGTIKSYDFWIDLNNDNVFGSNEFVGTSTNGEIVVDNSYAGFKSLISGQSYQMQVLATDNLGQTATSIDSFKVNAGPIFLVPGDEPTKTPGIIDNPLLADPTHTTDNPATPWIEGKLDAVKNDGSINSLNNIVQAGASWKAIANAYDPDGMIKAYDFWIDLNDDGTYSSAEFVGSSQNGEVLIDSSYTGFGSLKAGQSYAMKVLTTDSNGATAESFDSFSVNNKPVFLAPGDDPTKTPGIIDNPGLADPSHITDQATTPWVEGKLDAIKNDGSLNSVNNVIAPNSNWTAIANAYDSDGSIVDYHFFIKDGTGLFIDAGNSSTGELAINYSLFQFSEGQTYQMKVIATDNTGATAESLDTFSVNASPIFIDPNTTPGPDPNPATPWIEGKLDAVKNSAADPNTLTNIVQEGSSWTAIAKAIDLDGSVSKYDFWIDFNQDGTYDSTEYIGQSSTGEIIIAPGAMVAGQMYSMKALATDNSGAKTVSIDNFYVTNLPTGGIDAVAPPINYSPGADAIYGTNDDVADVDIISAGSNLNFGINVVDTNGIASYEYRIDGGAWQTGFITAASLTSSINAQGSMLSATTDPANPHTLEVKVIDTLGIASTFTDQVIVNAPTTGLIDAVATPSIQNDVDTITQGSNLNFGINVVDTNGIASYEYRIDGGVWQTGFTTAASLTSSINAQGTSLSATTDPANPHTLEVKVIDTLGIASTFTDQVIVSAPTTGLIDAVATPIIQADVDTISQGSNLNFGINVADTNGIASYEYRIDGGAWQTGFTTAASLTSSINAQGSMLSATTDPANPHSLEVKVIDTLGNTTTFTDQVIVNAPAVGLIDAVATPSIQTDVDTITQGSNLNFGINVVDTNGIASYEYRIDGGVWQTGFTTAASLTSSINAQGPSLSATTDPANSHSLEVKVIDTLGIASTFTDQVIVNAPTTGLIDAVATPSIQADFDTITQGSNLNFGINVADTNGIASYEYRIDGGAWQTGFTTAASLTSSINAQGTSLSATTDPANPHSLEVKVIDTLGIASTFTDQVIVNAPTTGLIDAVATPSIQTDVDTIYKGNTLDFGIDVSDPNGITSYTYALNGNSGTVTDIVALKNAINPIGATLNVGSYILTVDVKDTLGNITAFTDTINVINNANLPPTATLDAVKDNAADSSTLANVIQSKATWTIKATGSDPEDGNVSGYQFYLDKDGDGNYETYLGASADGELTVNSIPLGLSENKDYNVVVLVIDQNLNIGSATDTFHINAKPTVSLDADKATSPNIVPQNTSWTPKATGLDKDGTIGKYQFWLDLNRDGDYNDAGENLGFGNAATGEFNIINDTNQLGLINGLNYSLKVVATDNYGATAEAYDTFHLGTNTAPVAKDDVNVNSTALFNQNVTFGGYNSSSNQDIFTMNLDGSGLKNLTATIGFSVDNPTTMSWALNGSKFVYSGYDSTGKYGIFTANADGTGIVEVSGLTTSVNSGSPRISADGQYASFLAGGKLYIAKSDGSYLSSGYTVGSVSSDDYLRWSPKVNENVLVYRDSTTNDLWMIDTNGTKTNLTNTPSINEGIEMWSPKGGEMAFTANNEIFTVNTSGAVTKITNDGTSVIEGNLQWSPDGSKLLYQNSSNNGLFVINRDGTSFKQLFSGSVNIRDPIWSPDSSKIAYVNQTLDKELYIVNADASGTLKLTNTPSNLERAPFWSPDGTKIAFQNADSVGNTTGDIYVVKTDGTSTPVKISDQTLGGGSTTRVLWSTDGTKLFFTGTSQSKIEYANADGTGNSTLLNSSFTYTSSYSSSYNSSFKSPTSDIVVYNQATSSYSSDFDNVTVFNLTTGTSKVVSIHDGPDDSNGLWSPSYNKIAFMSNRGGNYQAYVMNSDGSGVTQLSNISGGISSSALTAADFNFKWSPDGTKVFLSPGASASTNDIFVFNADGSGSLQVTNTASSAETNVTWSPDSSKIFYTDTSNNLFVANASTGAKTQVTTGIVVNTPKWSPDSQAILFYRSNTGSADLMTIKADGTSLTNLTNTPSIAESNFSWSPDGTKLLYYSSNDVFAMNKDGTGLVNLSNTPGIAESTVTWSPDGSKVLFTTSADIFVVNKDGTNLANITNTAGVQELDVSWSPNGNKIAFRTSNGGSGNIFVVNPNGSNLINLTNSASANYSSVAWTPDSASITYKNSSNLFSVSAMGGTSPVNLNTGLNSPANFSFSKGSIFGGVYAGGSKVFNILQNDSDADGDPISITQINGSGVSVGQTVNLTYGKLTINSDYKITYEADSTSKNVVESFTYTIADTFGGTSSAKAQISIAGLNQAPIAVNDGVFTTNEDTSLVIQSNSILANDSDPDAETLSIKSVSQALYGTVTLSPNGANIVYTPNTNFNHYGPNGANSGTTLIQDKFTYIVTDESGATSSATVTIDVTPVNDAANTLDDFNSKIVYSNTNGDIYYKNSDGTGSPILIGSNLGSQPNWSPDGGKIAFVTKDGDVAIIDANGTGLTLLTNHLAEGQQYTYRFNPGGYTGWTTGTDTAYPEYNRISWSPDGSKLAFNVIYNLDYVRGYVASNDGASTSIRIVNVNNGTTAGTVDSNDFYGSKVSEPTWSADGTQIAYTKLSVANWYNPPETSIAFYNLAPGGINSLNPNLQLSSHPVASLDGTKIAFVAINTANSTQSLYIANADGSGEFVLSTAGSLGTNEIVSWLPGNKEVLLSNGKALNINTGVMRDAFNVGNLDLKYAADIFVGGINAQIGNPIVISALANDFDPDSGDILTLSFTGSDVAPAHGTIGANGTTITYTGTTRGYDTFTYTVTDSFGGVAHGTVSVYVFS
jgi:Tol biopolymer transport system component